MTKRVIGRLLGAVAVLASLGFLFIELRDGIADLGWRDVDRGFVMRWSAALALYLAGLTCVHVAWGVVIARSCRDAGVLSPTIISGRAQIGKYLPGNVAHIAGRQMLAARQGWPQQAVIGASLLEVVGLIVAGAIVVAVGAVFGVRVEIGVSAWGRLLIAALVLLALVGVAWLVRTRQLSRLRVLVSTAGSATPAVVGMYAVFLVLAGVGQWLLLEGAAPGTVIVAATGAWLVGFLSPGVPAGVGVREAVLAGTLALQPTQLTLGLIGFRAVTVLSDLVVFVVASLLTARLADRHGTGPAVATQN
jgi:hypothetical protein